MKRPLFNIATGISALLGVGTVVLWVHGFWYDDFFMYATSDTSAIIFGSQNWRLFYEKYERFVEPQPLRSEFYCYPRGTDGQVQCPAFYYSSELRFMSGWTVDAHVSYDTQVITAAIPKWFVLLISAPLPAWSLYRLSARRRRIAGTCQNCGYDLRATPDRCPECGTVPTKVAASA